MESSLFNLVEALKDRLEIQVLVSNTKPRTVIEKKDNLTVIRLANFGTVFSQPLTPALPLWLSRLKSDIIHVHLPNPLAMISYLLISPKARLIISYHSDITRQRWATVFLEPLLTKMLQKAEAIIVSSENLMNSSSLLRRFRTKCRIIPYGIEIYKFRSSAETLKKAASIREGCGSPLILFIGRLVYYKGLEYLFKAMRDIEARLLIVGDGPLRNRLKALSARYGLDGKVIWAGEVANKEIAPYYYACELIVLPSTHKAEGFGIVLLEALACGRAVVSTDLPTGVTFINIHGKTGLTVPPKNVYALKGAIAALLKEPLLRERYGQYGRERIETEFTRELTAERTLDIYKESFLAA